METIQVAVSRQRRWAALSVAVVALAVAAVVFAPRLLADTRQPSSASSAPATGYLYSAAPMFRTDLGNPDAPAQSTGYLYSAEPMFRTDLGNPDAPVQSNGYLYSAAPMFRTDLAGH